MLTRFAYTYTRPGTTTDTGLRQSVTDRDDNVTTYGYDKRERLTSAVTKNPLGITTADYAYAYDPVGNRTSDTANGVSTIAIFNDADQLSSRGGISFSYDANGNQTASTAGQALSYNSADQTTSLTKAGGSPRTASYAGTNQVERRTAGAASFTNTLLGVTAATEAGATVSTTRDPAGGLVGLRSGTSRNYYLVDGLGSVVALTDSSGAVTHSYAYDPYGVTTETTSSALVNPWRYTGQFQDVVTGLYKMGARYYQPDLGRWTQPDPSGPDANAYAYVGGDPVNFLDPSGLVRYNCGIISCSLYTSVGEARRINELLSDPEAILIYGGTSAAVCFFLAAGLGCGFVYLAIDYVAQAAFSEAARIGGCIRYTAGSGPNVGIEAVSPSNEFCDY